MLTRQFLLPIIRDERNWVNVEKNVVCQTVSDAEPVTLYHSCCLLNKENLFCKGKRLFFAKLLR